MTNSSRCLQQRRGSDCTAAQSDACFYPARHVLLILTREFLITKHLINCLYHFRPPYKSGDKWELTQIFDLINCRFTRSARQLGNPRVKSSLSRSAYGNVNELKSSVWLIHVKKYLVRAIIAFYMKKPPCGPCFEFESSSHRCSSLGCILTLNVWGNCRDWRTSSRDPWCSRQASSSDQSSTVYGLPSSNSHQSLNIGFVWWRIWKWSPKWLQPVQEHNLSKVFTMHAVSWNYVLSIFISWITYSQKLPHCKLHQLSFVKILLIWSKF